MGLLAITLRRASSIGLSNVPFSKTSSLKLANIEPWSVRKGTLNGINLIDHNAGMMAGVMKI
eukprot:10492450-Ditylum_brightwellii.AAC.1